MEQAIQEINNEFEISSLKKEIDTLKDTIKNLRANNNSYIYSALCKFQQEMPVITKNKEGFGKQRFASFSQTKQIATPILNKYGLHVEQHMVSVNGMPAIKTIVAHNSGQFIESLFEVPGFLFNDLKAPRNDSGANISYFKRHTYESILGIIIVD